MTFTKRDDETTPIHDSHIHEEIIPGRSISINRRAETIIAEIMKIYFAIKDLTDEEIYTDHSDYLKDVFQRLGHLIALDVDCETTEKILHNFGLNSAFDAITIFQSRYTAELEIEEANCILKSRNPWKSLKDFAYYSNYIQLARNEYEGARLKPGDSVIFLGSGALPLSLIILCTQHGLYGVGIEQNPERAEQSKRVLERLGLSEQITIVVGNHLTLSLEERPELIMVAAQAEPKKEIFDHLAEVLPAGAKVSYRIYETGLRRLLDTFSRYELPEQFKEYRRIRPKPPANNTSVFLRIDGRI